MTIEIRLKLKLRPAKILKFEIWTVSISYLQTPALNTFKGIITGEIMLKRLNKTKENYYESLKKLKTKCSESNFN